MSILNVEKIQPVGSGTTVTVNSGYLETPSIKGSDANFTGIVTATSFTGSGANLTSIPAGNLTGYGGVIQMVSATSNTTNQTPSGNQVWTDVNPSCSITMTADTNKVLVLFSGSAAIESVGNTGFRLLRGSTVLTEWWGYTYNNTKWLYVTAPSGWVDTPGAGTHTYKYQIYANSTYASTLFHFNYAGASSANSVQKVMMILQEFSA